jgi:nucleoside-diphosphate-sugar epimerase
MGKASWVADLGKIVITGAAGLVGQNLVPRLRRAGAREIVAIDKNRHNSAILARVHPDVRLVEADLAEDDGWQEALDGADALVVGHAQIGGLVAEEFVRNNVHATERLLDAAARHAIPYLVNISSSVVNSLAVDHYTETKKAQEKLVLASGIPQAVLRPTLMFGWFDRKHVGWLARFMARAPVFPVPGSGRYMRQPLYAGDFCDIIVAAIRNRITGAFNISGQARIDYIDLIRAVRRATGSRTPIVRVPYGLFWLMLAAYGRIRPNPPFTTRQLEALATPDEFEVIDWPGIFGVRSTPLDEALEETFRDPVYSQIVLQF